MGEVTVKQGIAPSRIIQVQDVTFQYNGKKPCRVQLVLRHYKTQTRGTLLLISLEISSNGDTCPNKALYDYRVQSPHLSGPVFQFKDGTPLSYSYVSNQISAALV